MNRSPAVVSVLALCALAGCKDNPSPLEMAPPGAHEPAAADPWGAITGSSSGDDDGKPREHHRRKTDDDKLGGFDVQSILTKVKDSVEKPGPYESPDQSAGFDAQQPHWGVMRLHGAIVEREAFSWTGGRGTELRALIERLTALAADDKLLGLVVQLDNLEISLPDAVELRAALHAYRKGHKLACHVDAASTGTYLVAAACESLAVAPLGEIVLPGPSAMPVHVKGLLDKLGIQADFVHEGAYKGAAEPLTRDTPSPEMIEVLNDILDGRYRSTVDIVARDRNLDAKQVGDLIDTATFSAVAARQAKLVDDVVTFAELRDRTIGSAAWTRIPLDADKQNTLETALKLARFLGAMPPDRPLQPHVALVYAVGNIVDGDGEGLLGARGEIAARTLIPALRALAADAAVKAVVLRIDSGGGSAQASELIWHAIAELKKQKPVFVSMSDVAASGGYYIASGATKIFALDDTLTGSIGVVGGKLAPAAGLAKIGVTTFPMGKGKHATMWSSLAPWTDDERHIVETLMADTYEVFKSRVADGRHKTVAEVETLAKGRVWTGAQALQRGLVDEIGGLDAALAAARAAGGVDAGTSLEVYPPSVTLRDVLHSFGQVSAPLGLAGLATELAAISAVDPRLGDAAARLVELVASFRTTAVQTVAILPVLQ